MMAVTYLPAGASMLAGLMLVWHGARIWFRGLRRPAADLNRLLVMVQGFRVGVIGLAVVGVSVWLLTGQLWVLIVSLGVGGEELLESSFIIWTLRTDPRNRRRMPVNPPELLPARK